MINNKLNIIPSFSSTNEIYFISGYHKINKGKIIGFCAEAIVVDENNTILKIGQGKYQVQHLKGIESVDCNLVFFFLFGAVKHLCFNDEIFLELKKSFQLESIKTHKEKQYNPVETFEEYQQIAMSTKAYGAGLPIFYPTIKLNGEAGEVAEKVGKIWRDKNGEIGENDKLEIKKELGDTLWYICAIADDLQFNLIDVANTNIAKILDRRSRNVVSGSGDNR